MFKRRVLAIAMIVGGWLAGYLVILSSPTRCRDLCRDLQPGEYCQAVCIIERPSEWIALGALTGVAVTIGTWLWMRRSSARRLAQLD